jgi:uncharacterized protein (DUF1778 family)
MASGQNVNMRVPAETLDSIVYNAKQNGQNITQYVLSWLPDTYQRAPSTTETPANTDADNGR